MTTNETQHTTSEHKPPAPFGTRLKAAREALGLDRKDAAAQLRLNEKVIIMMEKDRYPLDLPVTFIRGYIRAYGKLLQIPEYEIKKAIEPIKPKQVQLDQPTITGSRQSMPIPVTSGSFFMQFFTYLIVFTIIGLVGSWWYSHTGTTNPVEPQLNTAPEALIPAIQPPPVVGVESTPTPPPAAANTAQTAVSVAPNNNTAQMNNSVNAQQSTPDINKPIQKKTAVANNPSPEDPEAEDVYNDTAE